LECTAVALALVAINKETILCKMTRSFKETILYITTSRTQGGDVLECTAVALALVILVAINKKTILCKMTSPFKETILYMGNYITHARR